jgi:hypothetical protein
MEFQFIRFFRIEQIHNHREATSVSSQGIIPNRDNIGTRPPNQIQ